MDAAKVSADQSEHPNGTASVNSLKRKRASATDWFQAKRSHQEGSTVSSGPQLPATSLAREHTENGGMDSRYRRGEGDSLAKPTNESHRGLSHDGGEGARGRNQDSRTQDVRSTPDERGSFAPNNRRHVVEKMDWRSSKQHDDQLVRDSRPYDADEHRRGFKHPPPRGPSLSQKPENRAKMSPRRTSFDISMSNPTDISAQLSAFLTRFVSDASRQVSLQVKRDAAKKTLDRSIAEFEKGRQFHSSFKSIEEIQKAILDKAQREFDEAERELEEKKASGTALVGELASCLASSNGDGNGSLATRIDSKILAINEKIRTHREDWGISKGQLCQIEKESRETRETQKEYRTETALLNKKLAAMVIKAEEREREMNDLKKLVDKVSARAIEFPTQLIQMSKEISEVKGRSNEAKVLDKSLNEQMGEISDLKLQIYGDIGDSSNEGLKRTISRIEQDHQRFRLALGTLEKLTADISSRPQASIVEPRLQTIEERLIKMEGSQRKTPVPSGPLSSSFETLENAQKDLRVRMDGLQGAQDQADEIIGAAIQSLKSKSEDQERLIASLREEYGQEYSRLSSQIRELRADIESAHTAVASATANINANTNSTKVTEDIKSLHANMQGIINGLGSLDSRMNNLTTDTLARQILGQLDEHVRGAETKLQKLESRVHAQELRAQEPPTNIPPSVRMEIDALTAGLRTVRGDAAGSNTDIAGKLKSLTDQIGKVEAYLDYRRGSAQSSENAKTGVINEFPPSKSTGSDGARVGEVDSSTTNGQPKRKRQSELFVHSDSEGEDKNHILPDMGI